MAEHELNKIVDDDGEVFNLRDSTKQPVADRVTAWGSTPSDTKYPSEKLVKMSLDAKANDSDVVHKSGGTMYGPIQGYLMSTRATMVGNEYNCLLNAKERGILTFTQSGSGQLTTDQVWALFDGKIIPAYGPAIDQNDPYVLTIDLTGYITSHCQVFSAFGWTCRYWEPIRFKVELYNASANEWVTICDYSQTNYTGQHSGGGSTSLFVKFGSGTVNPHTGETKGGQFTKIRITIWKGNESTNRWGISEIFFCYPEIYSVYGGLHAYSSNKISTARKLAISLSNTSTDTPFDGSADVTNIKTTGTLGIGNGGTGKTTALAANNALISPGAKAETDIVDNTNWLFRYDTPSDSIGAVYYRKSSLVWNWIKGKISSVLSLTATSYGGNAATATTATTAAGYTSGGAIDTALQGKVDKETGKGLSTNDYTTTEKNKLAGIASGAEVNVQSDWNQTTTTADDYIKNKPSLATVATSGSYSDLSGKPDTIEWATYGTTTYDQVTAMLAAGNLPCARYGNEVFKYYMYASRSYKFMSENMTYVSVDESDVWSYGNDYPTPATIGAVPTSRTVNGKALSDNISLTASDVGSLPAGPSSGDYVGQSSIAWCIKVTRLATSGRGYAHITVDLSRSADGGDFGCVDIMLKADASDYYTVSYPHVRRTTDAKKLGQVLYANAGFMSVNGVLYLGVTCHGWSSQCSPRISSDMMDGQFTVEFGDFHASVQSSAAARTWFPVYANYNGSDMAAIGSDTIPVYIDQYGQVTPGKNRIQAVSNLNTSTMDSEVLYVL